MEHRTSHQAAELDLQRLEAQLEELIRAFARVQEENRVLKVQQSQLIAERAELIEKTEVARSRVEAMIGRLKSLETSS
jgi:cell division protein ZapB